MDFISTNIILIGIVLTSGGMLLWQAWQGHGGGKGLSPAQAVIAHNREKAVFIDVSEPRTETIKGAKRLELKNLETELPNVVKRKDSAMIFYCQRGLRADSARKRAERLGYTNAWVLAGGLALWKKENYPLQAVAAAAA